MLVLPFCAPFARNDRTVLMTFRSRLMGLAAAAALVIPATALIAAVPATAAQAATTCDENQATITFIDGSTGCQSAGTVLYDGQTPGTVITRICANAVIVEAMDGLPFPLFPGQCRPVQPNFGFPAEVRVVPLG